jgi:hypothetical protein
MTLSEDFKVAYDIPEKVDPNWHTLTIDKGQTFIDHLKLQGVISIDIAKSAGSPATCTLVFYVKNIDFHED